jgi:hypothetical protein
MFDDGGGGAAAGNGEAFNNARIMLEEEINDLIYINFELGIGLDHFYPEIQQAGNQAIKAQITAYNGIKLEEINSLEGDFRQAQSAGQAQSAVRKEEIEGALSKIEEEISSKSREFHQSIVGIQEKVISDVEKMIQGKIGQLDSSTTLHSLLAALKAEAGAGAAKERVGEFMSERSAFVPVLPVSRHANLVKAEEWDPAEEWDLVELIDVMMDEGQDIEKQVEIVKDIKKLIDFSAVYSTDLTRQLSPTLQALVDAEVIKVEREELTEKYDSLEEQVITEKKEIDRMSKTIAELQARLDKIDMPENAQQKNELEGSLKDLNATFSSMNEKRLSSFHDMNKFLEPEGGDTLSKQIYSADYPKLEAIGKEFDDRLSEPVRDSMQERKHEISELNQLIQTVEKGVESFDQGILKGQNDNSDGSSSTDIGDEGASTASSFIESEENGPACRKKFNVTAINSIS